MLFLHCYPRIHDIVVKWFIHFIFWLHAYEVLKFITKFMKLKYMYYVAVISDNHASYSAQ